jgi:UDP-glucose 4-epimerase
LVKVLVTGGAGFIGQAMIKNLLKRNVEVRAFDIVNCPIKEAESVVGSVMDVNSVNNAVRGCDHVIHLAAMLGVKKTDIRRLDCLDINILGTKNVLEACVKEGVKKVILSSSSEVYGDVNEDQITEESPLNPKSVYAVTKLCGEEYLQAYHRYYGLKYSIVRFFNVYGPNQVAEFVMPRFIKWASKGESPQVYGTGEQTRCFCYVDDAVEGVSLALFSEEANAKVFNIGNNTEPVSMKELALRVIKVSGKDIEPKMVPLENSDRTVEREIFKRMPSIEKAKKILGYTPKVSLDQGIKLVMDNSDKILETWFDPMTKARKSEEELRKPLK